MKLQLRRDSRSWTLGEEPGQKPFWVEKSLGMRSKSLNLERRQVFKSFSGWMDGWLTGDRSTLLVNRVLDLKIHFLA